MASRVRRGRGEREKREEEKKVGMYLRIHRYSSRGHIRQGRSR